MRPVATVASRRLTTGTLERVVRSVVATGDRTHVFGRRGPHALGVATAVQALCVGQMGGPPGTVGESALEAGGRRKRTEYLEWHLGHRC